MNMSTSEIVSQNKYFTVTKEVPLVTLTTYQDDVWTKGLYVKCTDPPQLAYPIGPDLRAVHWVKAKRKIVPDPEYKTCITIMGDVDIPYGKARLIKKDIPICEIWFE